MTAVPRSARRAAGAGQTPIEVWAPLAEQVEIEWTTRVTASTDGSTAGRPVAARRDDGRRRRLVALGAAGAAGRDGMPATASEPARRSTTRSCSTGRSRPCPTRAARGSRTASTARAAPSTRPRFAWTDDGWRGPRAGHRRSRLAWSTSCTSAPSPPRAPSTRPLARLDHLVDAGGRRRRADAGRGLPRPVGLGVRRRRAVRRARRLRRPGRLRSGSSTRATPAGSGSRLDVVHNHLGASGNYLARFGPYFTEAHHTPWGPAVNLDHEGAEHGAAVPRRERPALVPRLPRRRPAPRRRPRAQGRLAAALPRRAVRRRGRAVRRARAARSTSSPRATSTTPSWSRRPPRAAAGMTAQWDDDVHHALHVALTGETHGYYADFAGGGGARRGRPARRARQGADPRVPPRRHHVDLPRSPVGRARSTSSGLDARRLLGYLQTHDQVGNRMAGRPHLGDRRRRALQAAGAALYLLAPTTPMVFMGEEWAASTPWQFFTSFEDDGARRRRAPRAGGPSSGRTAGPADAVPDPQDPATRDRVGARLGRARRRAPRGACCAGTPRAPLCAASCSAPARPASPTSRCAFDEDARWLVDDARPGRRPASAVVVNLGDRRPGGAAGWRRPGRPAARLGPRAGTTGCNDGRRADCRGRAVAVLRARLTAVPCPGRLGHDPGTSGQPVRRLRARR